MGSKRSVLIALLALPLSACISETRIVVPAGFAESMDKLELKGMGGGESGDFELSGARGTFHRVAERSELFGIVEKTGGGSFAFEGLFGRCGFGERDMRLGDGVSVNADKLVYACGFRRDGRPLDAELWLQASEAKGLAMFRYEREGKLLFEGQEIDVKSLHHFEGGKFPAVKPLGYSFEIDGRQIGAIDLNGLDKTLYLPREPRQREAVLAASLALSVFWDPTDSD